MYRYIDLLKGKIEILEVGRLNGAVTDEQLKVMLTSGWAYDRMIRKPPQVKSLITRSIGTVWETVNPRDQAALRQARDKCLGFLKGMLKLEHNT